MLWNVAIYNPSDPKHPTELGRVRARNSPGAVVAAIRKYHVAPVRQRYVYARSVKPIPLPPSIPEEDKALLRQFSAAINAHIRGK